MVHLNTFGIQYYVFAVKVTKMYNNVKLYNLIDLFIYLTGGFIGCSTGQKAVKCETEKNKF